LVCLIKEHELFIGRNELLSELRLRNIGASVHYNPLHSQTYYSKYNDVPLPWTEKIANEILTLPISASMLEEDVIYIMDHFSDIISKKKSL
jgi:dTDP-4-amino-4,6-dideoxygalactose transaminase